MTIELFPIVDDYARVKKMEREAQIQDVLAVLVQYDVSLDELAQWVSGEVVAKTKTLDDYISEYNTKIRHRDALAKATQARIEKAAEKREERGIEPEAEETAIPSRKPARRGSKYGK